MDKSYVTMETNLCTVCAKEHDTGNLLLDKHLRDRFESKTCTGMDSLCSECQERYDDNYIALVAIHNTPQGENERIKQEHANRTGEIAHIRRHVFKDIFGAPCETLDGKPLPMVFVEPAVIEQLKEMVPDGE